MVPFGEDVGEIPLPEHSPLRRGEQLTYAVGGQNGYNKGGRASNYGNGGGMTSVVSDRKGILLIAGGGGGASPGSAPAR